MSCASISFISLPMDSNEFQNTSFRLSSLTPHAAITISSNADFAAQGWPGNGTEQSPYVIDSLEIVTDGTCVSIANTDVHFIISNCLLYSQSQDSGRGIYVSNVNNGLIYNNTIHDKQYSIRLYVVNYLEIMENKIYGCSADGIYMIYTSGVIIVGNKVYGNANLGLNVYSYTLYSEIYDNMIGFNSAGNANDQGMFNDWDDGSSTGNIWSDYSGVGAYSISGVGEDNYPRGFLSKPTDVEYVFGSSVPSVAWDVRLPNPHSYAMFWNDAIFTQGPLNTSLDHLSKAIDGLTVGMYNLTLVVNDVSGYSLVDTVIITVLGESTTMTTPPTTTGTTTSTETTTDTFLPPETPVMLILLIIGTIAVIVIVVFIVIRRK
ncbi:MAG: right-handed parallel beta-helix repeat-containing protein [Candidatus Thorarchaeota archaeon]|nr:right-handed parallel beta-helix repeat-containing protein [Candidatus Thorarchaeota archaeon]